MSITEETVREKLIEIKNQYNSYRLDDKAIQHYVDFITKDKEMERTTEDRERFLHYILSENYREVAKELKHFVIVKSKGNRYYIHSKKYRHPIMDFYLFKDKEEEIMKMILNTAETFNQIYEQGYVESEIEFPSGEVIFANFFHNSDHTDYAFEVPDDLKYEEINSINHLLGEQNTAKILSDLHGVGYVQLGNTSTQIFKVSDDKIVMTNTYFEDYNEYTDEELETEIVVPKEWQLLGEVCCDVWKVEFIDQVNFDKGNTMALDHENYQYNKPFRGKVNPGKWRVRNRYHLMDEDKEMKAGRIPIWVEMERIQDES
jgi:hypothetical protein